MKKLILALTVCAALAAPAARADVEVGKAAPDITFTDIKGASHSIAGFKGKTVILEWSNPGCPFVKKFYDGGDMPKIQAEALAMTDLNPVWIAVNSSANGKEGHLADNAAAQKWVDDNKFAGIAYVRDESGAFGKLYGAKTTPHMFVINKDGNVVYQGAIDSIKSADQADIAKADNYVLAALNALAKGEAVKTTSTPPYGCSVKYAE